MPDDETVDKLGTPAQSGTPAQPGDRVGRGRVIANPGAMGRHEDVQPKPGERDADPKVDEASDESFPASDPPGYSRGPGSGA